MVYELDIRMYYEKYIDFKRKFFIRIYTQILNKYKYHNGYMVKYNGYRIKLY